MDRLQFLEETRAVWDRVEPGKVGAIESQLRITNHRNIGEHIAENRRWPVVAHRTFVELLNVKFQQSIFSFLKGLVWKKELSFGSSDWFHVFYGYLFHKKFTLSYSVVRQGEVGDFFLLLREPNMDDFDRYVQRYMEKGYPVFAEKSNDFLRRTVDKARREGLTKAQQAMVWLKVLKLYYRTYFKNAADIYTLSSTKQPDEPHYRLIRSIGISPDQNVYLAETLDGTKQVVVKWVNDDPGEDQYLKNWKAIRRTGAKMINFNTTYEFSPQRDVLVMEKLHKIDHTDNLFRFFSHVFRQLSDVHRASQGPYAHSDIKLDNIMKRMNADDSREYFVIDWDAYSSDPIKDVPNAVVREAYSPLWTSQVQGHAHPTSYRYDLQELFYSGVDLNKKKQTSNYRRSHPGAKVPQWMADSDTLIKEIAKRDITGNDIAKEMHLNHIPGVDELSDLFNMIVKLPERLPPNDINYDYLADFVEKFLPEKPIESRIADNSASFTNTKMADKCYVCQSLISDAMKISSLEGHSVHVCGIVCAALENPDYERAARVKKTLTGKVRLGNKLCSACGTPTDTTCFCGTSYCGEECQRKSWSTHRTICTFDPASNNPD